MSRVYVIIVNWNGCQDTVECLDSLLASSYADYRVVVCDNGSSDGSLDRLSEWCLSRAGSGGTGIPFARISRQEAEAGGHSGSEAARVVLIDIGENLGFAGANNVGLRYALHFPDFHFAWLLNNDTTIDPDALHALVDRMEARPDSGMCGSTLLYYDQPDKVQALGGGYYCRWIGLPWHIGRFKRAGYPADVAHVERWMNYVVGASLFVRRELLETVGLMAEDYYLYFEETDWAIRSRGRFTLSYAPDSIVYHKVGRSIGTSTDPRKKSRLCDFYSIRNRIFFTMRFYPYALPSVYLVLIGALLVRILLGRWDRVGMIMRLLLSGGDLSHGREKP